MSEENGSDQKDWWQSKLVGLGGLGAAVTYFDEHVVPWLRNYGIEPKYAVMGAFLLVVVLRLSGCKDLKTPKLPPR